MTDPGQPDDRQEGDRPDPPPPFAKSWAVVIGIDEYGEGIPALANAVNDARKVARTLSERHGYEVIPLFDREATQERLKDLLYRELPEKVEADHRVFFYWAGHGVRTESDTGPDGYLLPSDAQRGKKASYLHMPGVHDALLDLPCRHMMVILDTCFSGAFRWSGMRDIGRVTEDVIHRQKYDRFVKDAAWQVISSASQDQTALDELVLGSRGGESHSPFAQFLFQALGGEADVMGGEGGRGDGLVTAHELYLYIDNELGKATEATGVGQKAQLWPLKKHDKGEFVFFLPGWRPDHLPPAPPLDFQNNAWLGLRSYEEEDADLFFGRKDVIEDPKPDFWATSAVPPDDPTAENKPGMKRGLLRQVEEHGLTVVFGASGIGKSSLVKAGLMPRLSGPTWLKLPVMRPGASPLRALRRVVAPPGGAASSSRGSADGEIRRRVEELLNEDDTRKLVLVVDQFEELITLAEPKERDAFLELLTGLLQEHDRLRVIVTVRSDFEPRFHGTALGDLWRREESRFQVHPMSRNALRKVIEMPAAKRVLYFEPSSLVETLVDEVAATPGALPLLSFALSELYKAYVRRPGDDRAITQDHYREMGGVAGALRRRADDVYDGMAEAQQATLQHVMLRAVVREGGHLVRRRVPDIELEFPDEGENERRKDVVERLLDEGLLVRGGDAEGLFVEPAHDALVREWEELRTWVRQLDEGSERSATGRSGKPRLLGKMRGLWRQFWNRRGEAVTYPLEQRQRLARATAEWAEAEKKSKSGLLWSDEVRSAKLSSLVKAPASWLNTRELEFATSSIDRRELHDATRTFVRLLVLGLALLAIVFGVRATVLAAIATSRQLAAETANAMRNGDLDLAALLAVEASVLPAPDVRSPVMTWQLTTPRLLGYLPDTMGVFSVALSPGGDTLASAGEDGTVILWDVEQRRPVDTLRGATTTVTALAYSLDGKTLASAARDSTVLLWDVGRRQPRDTLLVKDGAVAALAFGPDGRMLATGGGTTITLWEVPAGPRGEAGDSVGPTRRFAEPRADHPGKAFEDSVYKATPPPPRSRVVVTLQPGGPIRSVALSPDGTTLSSVIEDGRVKLWSITHLPGRRVKPGETLWSISGDNPRLWPRIYRGSHPEPVVNPHWIYPGDVLDQGIETKSVRRPVTQRDGAVAEAFSPDGRALAVAYQDTTIIIWDMASGAGRDTLHGPAGGASSVAFSPDGSVLASGTVEGEVMVWNVAKEGAPRRNGDPLHGHADAVTRLAFRPDSPILVSASEDGRVVVWNIEGTYPTSSEHASGPRVTLVTGGNGEVALRDVDRNGRMGAPPTAGPFSIAFSPDTTATEGGAVVRWSSDSLPEGAFTVVRSPTDSNTIVSVQDGTAVLWDVSRFGQATEIGALSHPGVTSVAFGAPRDTVRRWPKWNGPSFAWHKKITEPLLFASAHDDGTVWLWQREGRNSITYQGALTRRGADAATSVSFSPDGKTLATGYADGTIVRWNADTRRRRGSTRLHRGRVEDLAYSPDGKTLASASADSTVMLWDVESMRRRGEPLRGLFESVAFSPDNATLAGVNGSGEVTFWELGVDSLKRRACAAAGRNFSEPEWRETFGDRYERACAQYPPQARVSGEGWWDGNLHRFVRGLADSPRLLQLMGYAWVLLFLSMIPYLRLHWRRRTRPGRP